MHPKVQHERRSVLGLLSRIRASKFATDVAWNLVTYGILGASGLLLSTIIGGVYGMEAMGIFRQVFAAFILVSQLNVLGLHFSVTKHVAEFSGDRNVCCQIITAALLLTATVSGVVTVLAIPGADWLGWAMDSEGVRTGWLCALPGLFFFAINKVQLAALNGFRLMKAFGAGQAVRYVLLVLMLLGCIVTGVPGAHLPIILSGTEIVLFLILFAHTRRFFQLAAIRKCGSWVKRHAVFGVKGMVSGALTELNATADLLILGLFCSDAVVGVYGMASIIVEGIAELSMILRYNLNPLLTKFIAQRESKQLEGLIRRGKRLFFSASVGMGIVALAAFPPFVYFLLRRPEFIAGFAPFAILILGYVLRSGYAPFGMIFIQAGYPGIHSWMIALTVMCNILLNLLLIPVLGMVGAAVATGAAYLVSIAFLKVFAWRLLAIRM